MISTEIPLEVRCRRCGQTAWHQCWTGKPTAAYRCTNCAAGGTIARTRGDELLKQGTVFEAGSRAEVTA